MLLCKIEELSENLRHKRNTEEMTIQRYGPGIKEKVVFKINFLVNCLNFSCFPYVLIDVFFYLKENRND